MHGRGYIFQSRVGFLLTLSQSIIAAVPGKAISGMPSKPSRISDESAQQITWAESMLNPIADTRFAFYLKALCLNQFHCTGIFFFLKDTTQIHTSVGFFFHTETVI